MTAALASEGGLTTSASIYTGTVIFDTVLMQAITKLLIPILYAYIAISIALPAANDATLKNFKGFSKWLMTWTLKLGIYIFTGYLGITRVVSGVTDAAALKAAKLTISGTVPVVGGIISDASEAILVGTSLMRNTAGIYGILAIISICLVPFLTIGVQYLLLKLTAGICEMFHTGKHVALIRDFTFALGILLATTGTICIIQLVSIVCFMKGVS
jgi:stage III sporulation protein AE